MVKDDFNINEFVDFNFLAWSHAISREEAENRFNAGMLAMPIGGVKAQCTGHNSHKPAAMGWVRVGMFKNGKYAIGMSEAGNAKNIQNSRGLQDKKKIQSNLWPLRDDDGGYIDGVSGHSYRFKCRRCSRDFQLQADTLGRAAQTMIVNGYRYLDLSMLSFG